jgi:hypothetical protein
MNGSVFNCPNINWVIMEILESGGIKFFSIFLIGSFFTSFITGGVSGQETHHEYEVPEKLEYSFEEQPVLLSANFEEDLC